MDTGNYALHQQPEEVYYYNKKLSLKQNWDIEQSWNIFDLPVDEQKPMAIRKNKPLNYSASYANSEDEDEGDEFNTNFNTGNYPGNKFNDMKNSSSPFGSNRAR